MSFTNLTSSDKEAFFSLLDEYFSSRPDLLAGGGGRPAAAAAAQNAFSNVSAQDVSAAVNRWRKPSPDASASNSDAGASPGIGRVAAAAAALKNTGFHQSQASSGLAPRPPPRRSPSTASADDPPPEHNKLVPQKKFGDVDISSGKAMFSSLRNSTANKTAAPPQVAAPVPTAFARRGGFAPPPVRRAAAVETQPAPAPAIPRRQEVQEEEPEGEWAEALYDYSSEDPGDLPLEANQKVLVVEKNSEDWWTGEVDGRRGLIPAAYVKVLS